MFRWPKVGQRRAAGSASGEPPNAIEWEGVGVNAQRDIHDILDALPGYFEDMRALRKVDETAYQMFSTLGGTIVGRDSVVAKREIDPSFLNDPPAVRCVFFGKFFDEDHTGRALYLLKMAAGRLFVTDHGCVVTPTTGLNYRLTVVWRIKGKTWALAGECYINIQPNGSTTILREKLRRRQTLPNRGGSFTRAVNDIPGWVKEATAAGHGSPEEWVAGLVAICASAKRPKETILVRAHKGGTAAAWSIDRRDAKRFFREREGGLTDRGARKRVLHFVGEFERTVAGKAQTVRAHYRGEREFEWNGYRISISGLGFHHPDFFDAPLEGHSDVDRPRAGMISMGRAAKVVLNLYNRPRFLSPRRKAA